jgi:predicted DNA-binding transcriptional regulator AlpA
MPSPNIDELLASLEAIPAEKIPAVISMLAARLLTTTNGNGAQPESADRLLTAQEAGEVIGISADWLYDHWKQLPFVVQLPAAVKTKSKNGDRKQHLRFSKHGIQRWIKSTIKSRAG